jgi:AraC-like DNA-binding protein
MTSFISPKEPRTSFAVRHAGEKRIEVISGQRHCWRFRPHYHAGEEMVLITAGRARLQLRASYHDVEAGETIVVPAGLVHHFVPLDTEGWAFRSEFVSGARTADLENAGALSLRGPLSARARDVLSARYSLQTDVHGIAAACSVSAGHLSRAFRRETGTSLHNFHVLMALHKAKNLLREHTPVVDAALDAGFCDQAHLTREFVRTLGMTPGTFRSAWLSAL